MSDLIWSIITWVVGMLTNQGYTLYIVQYIILGTSNEMSGVEFFKNSETLLRKSY